MVRPTSTRAGPPSRRLGGRPPRRRPGLRRGRGGPGRRRATPVPSLPRRGAGAAARSAGSAARSAPRPLAAEEQAPGAILQRIEPEHGVPEVPCALRNVLERLVPLETDLEDAADGEALERDPGPHEGHGADLGADVDARVRRHARAPHPGQSGTRRTVIVRNRSVRPSTTWRVLRPAGEGGPRARDACSAPSTPASEPSTPARAQVGTSSSRGAVPYRQRRQAPPGSMRICLLYTSDAA